MIRIWNYNTLDSSVDDIRVENITITELSKSEILFAGKVCKSILWKGLQKKFCFEQILFTEDPEILRKISV